MAEYEVERTMPGEAEIVFDIAADLERLDRWLPPTVHITPTAPNQVEADIPPRQVHAAGLVGVERHQLRMEWGSRDNPDYAGWLQVAHAEAGTSSATLHLSFLGHQAETRRSRANVEQVRAAMAESLNRLAAEVEQRMDDTGS